MRPLELRLAHFGPYRGQAVLNFEALDRLFLVCGPTGAGKTTLFDALTFALYEKTAGTRGGLADQLASHHAPPGSVPEVSLRFSLGAEEWRITRQLRHQAPKKKGEGWTTQEPQALLEHKVAGVWEPVPGKRTEINLRLESMLGLSAEEFGKIVVLPQGDFQRFLEASTGDREKMLQKLFPVETYDRMVDALKLRAKTVEEARRRWEDRWEELTARLGPGGDDRPALEAAWEEAAAGARSAAGEEAQAASALTQLKALHADWAALGLKRDERARLETRRGAREADRARLDRARSARPWGPDLDRQEAIKAEGLGLRAEQDKAKQALAQVEAELQTFASTAAVREARDLRLDEVMKQRGVTEHLAVQWNESRSLRTQEAGALAEERRAEGLLRSAQADRAAAEAGLPDPSEAQDPAEVLAALEQARNEDREARDRAAAGAKRHDLERRLTLAEIETAQAAREDEAAGLEEDLWSQVVEALKAASLADGLAEGSPCPVCGSDHHPRPAAWPEASEEAPRRLEAARTRAAQSRTALAGCRARQEALQAEAAALPPFGPASRSPEETALALQAAQDRFDGFQRWTKAWEQGRQAVEAAGLRLTQAEQAYQEAVRTRTAFTIRLQALAETLSQDPGPVLETLKTEEAGLRTAIDRDRSRAEAWDRDRTRLRAKVEGLEGQLEAQRVEYRRLQAGLDAAAAGLGWTLDEVRAARLPETEFAGLEAGVAAFDRELHRLDGETAALEARFPSGPPAPLEPAEAALNALKLRRESLDALAKEKEFALRDRDRIDEELREVGRQKQALEADFQRLVPLARALDGHNPLNLRLTTWVLVQALEQVARSATHRLASMSGGRYALKVETRGSDARKDWGLDLAVVDGYTGQERAVGTLSGGEKFMTSISLALGLADVIQERSGGLKLEAIFIDEGFGTLDDQSLDRAMAILHDLGQHRSVGIISHVAELRQRISSRVEVIKGKNGSTLVQ